MEAELFLRSVDLIKNKIQRLQKYHKENTVKLEQHKKNFTTSARKLRQLDVHFSRIKSNPEDHEVEFYFGKIIKLERQLKMYEKKLEEHTKAIRECFKKNDQLNMDIQELRREMEKITIRYAIIR